ncbi:MAG: hypothetical protein HKN11_06745 [Rhizobiales bacterium]|nr:hypothetical protein [Hyphomicrobiales bacterium]
MTRVHRLSEASSFDGVSLNNTDSVLDSRNNFCLYIFKISLLSILAVSFSLFEFTVFFSAKNFPTVFFIVLFSECLFFISLRRKQKWAPDIGFVHDLFWAVMAPLIAIYAREGFFLSAEEVSGSTIYVVTGFCVAVCVFPLFSMRQELWGFTSPGDLLRVAVAVLLNVVLVTFIVFIINRHAGVARTVPMLHLLFLLVPLLGLRITCRFFSNRADTQEDRTTAVMPYGSLTVQPQHVLLIGVNRLSEFYINMIEELGDGSVEVVGLLSDEVEQCGCQIRSIPVVGTASELRNVLHEFDIRGVNVDRIILCCPWQQLPGATQRALLEAKAQRPVRIQQIEDRIESLNRLFGFRHESAGLQHSLLGNSPGRRNGVAGPGSRGQHGQASANRNDQEAQISSYFGIKRVIDIIMACVLLILFSPVMLLVAILVSATIGFPGMFWQKRPGQGGKVFRVHKFRTMLAPFDRDGNRVPEAARTTRLCNMLRRSRLDELPQLFNILAGDMSLVGPRPLLPVDQPRDASLRLLIRPGVTGWAQVNGGIDLTAEEKLALDLWYVRHANLWLDIKIIFKSVVMIFRGDRKDNAAIGMAMSELAVFDTNAV